MCVCFVAFSENSLVQKDEPPESQQPESPLPKETSASVETQEPAETPQDELDKQKILEFVFVLGLDDNTEYANPDWFDIESSEERNMLIMIQNISEDRFAKIEEHLKQTGYTQPQDPTYVEEDKTRFIHYSNNALFMEIVYYENDMILNVHFMPQVTQ